MWTFGKLQRHEAVVTRSERVSESRDSIGLNNMNVYKPSGRPCVNERKADGTARRTAGPWQVPKSVGRTDSSPKAVGLTYVGCLTHQL